MQQHPLVSVIIPVLNNPEGIRRLVHALQGHTWPSGRMEIIVVDNGSEDETAEVARQLPVRLFIEDSAKTPYKARNRGIAAAKGEVIAFTDADCIPDKMWLENGVNLLKEEHAELVGGLITFEYSDPVKASERYDSLVNLEVKQNVAERGAAKTSNLIVKSELFDIIGYFRDDIRSGGDVEWTRRAAYRGRRIVFGENVIVRKRARTLGPLLKKFVRVGQGQPALWRGEGLQTRQMAWRILWDLRPASPKFIRSLIAFREQKDVENSMISLMAVAWLGRLAMGWGRLKGLFR
ncbi:MAG: glycosyltransferase [Balneolaceae bacterium]